MEGKGLYLPEAVVTDTQIGAAQKIVLAVMLANAELCPDTNRNYRLLKCRGDSNG